jgi:hypothetical protein
MTWILKPRKQNQAPRFRPTVECLEGRALPSVTVTQFIDPSGAAGLRVVENGSNDTVTITDDSTAGTTTVVADGMSQTFTKQFADFDLRLMGQKDSLEFDVTGAYSARRVSVLADLGKGENHFTFNPGRTAITNHSDLSLDVVGHNGNDFVSLSFGDILESRVNVNEQGIGGSKARVTPPDIRDSITFGIARSGIRNSSIDVNVSLGTGNTNFQFNYGSDLGHIGEPFVASDFGPSTMNVSITASGRSQDVDNITLFANGEINTGSTLNWDTKLGAGNNTFKAIFDANLWQVDDDGGFFISGPHLGGAGHFNVEAGSGKDAIDIHSINQDHTIELSGLFDFNITGGSGKDAITVDFGGAGGFTDDDPFELRATNRAFRLRITGGTGTDTIDVNLSNAPTATFTYDIAIVGGSAHNDITFVGVNNGGTPNFGPAGAVSIDGGGGTTDTEVFGNFSVQTMNTDL